MGFVAYEVDQSSLPAELVIEQRGGNADHYEIVPADGAFPPEEEFQALLDQVSYSVVATAATAAEVSR
jgi:hypothetical protein